MIRLFLYSPCVIPLNTAPFRRHYLPLRSLVTASRRLAMDPRSSKSGAGVHDFVHVEDHPVPLGEGAFNNSDGGTESNDACNNSGHYVRKVLPEELSRSVVTLTCDSAAEGGVCDVFLVGTAHVSKESCQEVQAVINFLKPQAASLLTGYLPRVMLQPNCCSHATGFEGAYKGEMLNMWKKNHNLFGILYSWFLAKVASKLEVFPGEEFRVAYEEAKKYGGRVILGDRPVQVTLQRTWAKMPLWHKTKLLYSFMFQAFFLPSPEDLNKALKEMDDVDMLTLVIQEMSKQFPTLMETLVHERDKFMSASLLSIASGHNSVVAVIGKGHLRGISENWKQPIEVKQLLSIPPQNRGIPIVKMATAIGLTVAGVAIISGLYLSSKK